MDGGILDCLTNYIFIKTTVINLKFGNESISPTRAKEQPESQRAAGEPKSSWHLFLFENAWDINLYNESQSSEINSQSSEINLGVRTARLEYR